MCQTSSNDRVNEYVFICVLFHWPDCKVWNQRSVDFLVWIYIYIPMSLDQPDDAPNSIIWAIIEWDDLLSEQAQKQIRWVTIRFGNLLYHDHRIAWRYRDAFWITLYVRGIHWWQVHFSQNDKLIRDLSDLRRRAPDRTLRLQTNTSYHEG